MRLAFCVLFVALIFALPVKTLEKENQELTKANSALRQVLKTLATGAERAVGQDEQDIPQLDTLDNDCDVDSDCKEGEKCVYDWWWGKDFCEPKKEEQVAGGCYTESGSCKSGYYKLSGGLKCCPRLSEKEVGFSNYKCAARNNCIYECQMDDEDKSWYSCMKECPKKLCEKDDTSDSVDPEDSDSEEEAVGLTCSKDGFEGTVTSDSWCDKRDGAWMHKCSDCKHGYYWYWWHTYCCVRGKGGCTCAYN